MILYVYCIQPVVTTLIVSAVKTAVLWRYIIDVSWMLISTGRRQDVRTPRI